MYREIVSALRLAGMLVSPVAADPPSWAVAEKGNTGKNTAIKHAAVMTAMSIVKNTTVTSQT